MLYKPCIAEKTSLEERLWIAVCSQPALLFEQTCGQRPREHCREGLAHPDLPPAL